MPGKGLLDASYGLFVLKTDCFRPLCLGGGHRGAKRGVVSDSVLSVTTDSGISLFLSWSLRSRSFPRLARSLTPGPSAPVKTYCSPETPTFESATWSGH